MNQLQNPIDFLHLFEKTKRIPERTVELQHIPTSAISGERVDELKNCIRKSLDEHANRENNTYHKKYLLTLFSMISYSQPPAKDGTTSSRMNII